MDIPTDYINRSIVKCRARNILYHDEATKWGRVHWGLGIANSVVAAVVTVLSFFAKAYGLSGSEIGVIGGYY